MMDATDFDATAGGANLCHQLMQREMDTRQQGNPKAFASHLFRKRFRLAKNLFKTDLRAHYGCVNAIEFSHGGKYLASGGDDKRVLIWDVEKAIAGLERRPAPRGLDTEHTSNIFCLGFDRHNRKVFSGGNDDLVIVHDFETGKLTNVFPHVNPVYGLSIDPQCDSVFATACEDGQILVFDQRVDPAVPFVVAQLRTSFHAVEFHPSAGNFLVTANSKRGAAFWDIRKPHHPVIQYGYVEDPPSCMSVRFNSTGSLILALRRRLPPILYNSQSPEPVCTFYHGNYYNSCTMKSCTFAGEDDEFVLSGSDDFNLYVWRVSEVDLERTDQWVETTQMVLYGHRSIVNQVRYNRDKCLLASSGVEKIVKLWSPFAQKGWTGSLLEEANSSDNPRDLYSPYNFASMSTPPHSWSHMSHDYSSRNTSEDPRMMAFFDSLIQQEIEGWETNSSTDSTLGSEDSGTHSSSHNGSDSSMDDDDDDDDDNARNAGRDRNGGMRAKRNLIKKKKKEHKRRTSAAKMQRHKYANRIAYLIATKRNTLRRLAIKGASLSNRLCKLVKVGRKPKTTGCVSKTQRAAAGKRSAHHISSVRGASGSRDAVASTSAATSSSLSNYRSQRRKHKKDRVYDTSSDDDADSKDPVASCSNRCNSTLPNNLPVPSTSTGITSSLKDDIIRLRRQQQHIIDSDEDDDDDIEELSSGPAQQHSVEVVVDPLVQPTKKLNGVRRNNDAVVVERSSSNNNGSLTNPAPQQQRNHLRPIISAALNIAAEVQTAAHSSSTSQTSATTTTTMLPQTSDNSNNSNSRNHNSNINRRRPHSEFIDNYSSHSNSRLSNSSYQDYDALDSSSSSNSSSECAANQQQQQQQQQHHQQPRRCHLTPLKRRKLVTANCIEENNNSRSSRIPMASADLRTTRSTSSNNNNNMTATSLPGESETSSIEDEEETVPLSTNNQHRRNAEDVLSAAADAHQRDQQSRDNIASTSTAAHLLHTPDSGISVATITPDYTDSNTPTNNAVRRLVSPCDESSANGHKSAAGRDLFQQKVARVRRNYRKKFADDSDSD